MYKIGKLTNFTDIYVPDQACSPFTTTQPCRSTNGIEDHTYGLEECCFGLCPPKRMCAKPDKGQCFIGLSKDGEDPLVSVGWFHKAPFIKCKYDPQKVNTVEQLKHFNLNNALGFVVNFCSKESTTCAKPQSKCSKLLSLDEDGMYCRLFVSKHPELKSNIITQYCGNHSYNYDCKCVNRHLYKDYKDSKEGHPIPDNCWYKPCTNDNILNKDSKVEGCPTNMCNIILDAHANKNVAFTNNEINCNFNKGGDNNHYEGSIILYCIVLGLLIVLA